MKERGIRRKIEQHLPVPKDMILQNERAHHFPAQRKERDLLQDKSSKNFIIPKTKRS